MNPNLLPKKKEAKPDACRPSATGLATACATWALMVCLLPAGLHAQTERTTQPGDRIHYTGTELSNPNHHDGQLSPVVGVHSIQTMRANRAKPMSTNGNAWEGNDTPYTENWWTGNFSNADAPYTPGGNGWTYNHQPMMAYWHGRFYVHFLSDPVDEHIPPSCTFLQTSTDGYRWTGPVVLFPTYPVPDGYTKDGRVVAHNIDAVMHQRVGFFVASNDRLLAIGNYGVSLYPKDDPNDGHGIGRVVREIYDDGSFGPIYFIYYNHAFNQGNTDFPHYTKSGDKGFRRACEELLANPLQRMQWVEEADRGDPLIPLNKELKAFCWYTLPDGRIACLWKHAITSISNDGGNTWEEPIERAQGFVNSNAKIWGQRLSDGTYATVYNPSEFRWPLAISLSSDGLEYTTLNLVYGDVPPMRYAGQYKSFGPQYVRGIQEGNGTPPDGDLWVTYSVNKEDIWVSHIPVPVQTVATSHADEDFADYAQLADLRTWNVQSGVWTPVSLEQKDGTTWLTLRDKDPFLDARVERKIPPSRELTTEFDLMAEQADHGMLQIEFLDEDGTACARLDLTPEGEFRSKSGARYGRILQYEAGRTYHVKVDISLTNRTSVVYVDGKKRTQRMLFAPVKAVERIALRTGERRTQPTVDTWADQYADQPDPNREDPLATFRIANVKSTSGDSGCGALLSYSDFSHYVDYFNTMEDENVVQAIPNSEASAWMERNIPLFACPDCDMEEMFYYRWWTLRKHIKETPVGYAMTEFLVPRSYADQYNLISCALGHHIYESRWLRDPAYLDGIIRTWYRGNNGEPMAKMRIYSSWNPDAVLGRYLVTADLNFLADLYPDLCTEYADWESTHRLENGLYWQADVKDGMEESISGGRKKQYARPTINSYMFGNAQALATAAHLLGRTDDAERYSAKAEELRQLVTDRLWNPKHKFFETVRGDTCAGVREAIGFIPWYFGLPSGTEYDVAWHQLEEEKGFMAPRGLTTAERRHPEFRTHGVGRCEWDGAIWPFATAQTLTALAHYLQDDPQEPAVSDTTYFHQLRLYVEQQHHRGRPYIGEYLDEVTGYWLKGDQERSRYYNHSTFNDLIITGLVGLRPRADRTIEVHPLLPDGQWDWFCLDRVAYHGHDLTIVWDRWGNHYHLGPGLHVLVDGHKVGHSDVLGKVVCEDALPTQAEQTYTLE